MASLAPTTANSIAPGSPATENRQEISAQNQSNMDNSQTSHSREPAAQGELEGSDDGSGDDYSDDDDLFDDELNDQDWASGGGDITKSYNKQRASVEKGAAPAAAKPNAQKPRANITARIDDQISSLAKFASRIKLGDLEDATGGGKGDKYVDLIGSKALEYGANCLIPGPMTSRIVLQASRFLILELVRFLCNSSIEALSIPFTE